MYSFRKSNGAVILFSFVYFFFFSNAGDTSSIPSRETKISQVVWSSQKVKLTLLFSVWVDYSLYFIFLAFPRNTFYIFRV